MIFPEIHIQIYIPIHTDTCWFIFSLRKCFLSEAKYSLLFEYEKKKNEPFQKDFFLTVGFRTSTNTSIRRTFGCQQSYGSNNLYKFFGLKLTCFLSKSSNKFPTLISAHMNYGPVSRLLAPLNLAPYDFWLSATAKYSQKEIFLDIKTDGISFLKVINKDF